MFVIAAKPLPQNQQHAHLKGAHVHIWVDDSSESNALDTANQYINRYGWSPIKVEYAFEIQQAQIPQLGASESRLYENARRFGIAADFLASPLVEGKPNDPVRLERMNPMS